MRVLRELGREVFTFASTCTRQVISLENVDSRREFSLSTAVFDMVVLPQSQWFCPWTRPCKHANQVSESDGREPLLLYSTAAAVYVIEAACSRSRRNRMALCDSEFRFHFGITIISYNNKIMLPPSFKHRHFLHVNHHFHVKKRRFACPTTSSCVPSDPLPRVYNPANAAPATSTLQKTTAVRQ